MKSNHTTGPWYLDRGQIRDKDGDALASVPYSFGGREDHANGVLIAAAPELLAAARNAANVLAALATGQLNEIKPDSNALAELRAAIAKAEGRAE